MDDQKPVSRRKLLGAGAAVAALTAGTALIARHKRTRAVSVPPGVKTSAAERPNILLIMSDQERRWQDLPKELTWPAHERLFELAPRSRTTTSTPRRARRAARRSILANTRNSRAWWSTAACISRASITPALFRGTFDGRYKFARYFKPAQHHKPRDFETLVKFNELELFDTERDPHELSNLALTPETVKEQLLRLNAMTNALIDGVTDQR